VDATLFLLAVCPNLITLHIPGADSPKATVHYAPRVHRCGIHQRENRSLVQARHAGDGANTHSLKHQREGFCCGFRRGVVSSQLRNRFAECRFAGSAAPALNAALTEVTESLADLVLASEPGHEGSPLAFCEETRQNRFSRSKAWVTPRFGLAPPTARTADGAIRFSYLLGGGLIAKLGLLSVRRLCGDAQGRSYLRPKSFRFFVPTHPGYVQVSVGMQLVRFQPLVKPQFSRLSHPLQGVRYCAGRIRETLQIKPNCLEGRSYFSRTHRLTVAAKYRANCLRQTDCALFLLMNGGKPGFCESSLQVPNILFEVDDFDVKLITFPDGFAKLLPEPSNCALNIVFCHNTPTSYTC